MKRAMLHITLLLLLTLSGYGQNVPNGGFETWDTADFYVLQDWVSYGRPQQTEDAVSGNYALKLENLPNAEGNYYASSIFNVDWQNGDINKFPYDGDPLSMVFDAKYNLYSGDSAYFISGFYEKGIWIGEASIKVTGNSSGQFLTYSVPITWYTSSRTPDSVFVGMSSLSHNRAANGSGYIIVDDFRYENIGYRTKEINNYDFENWNNDGVRYPKEWMPIDLLAFREWGGFLMNKSVLRSTEAFRGEHCLAIHNFDSWNDETGRGYCFTGDTSYHAWRPAFPITQKYKYLQGYYKLENGGNDTAEIAFNVFRAGNYLGEGRIRIGGNQEEWAFFSIPVRYYADFTPDSATLRLRSSLETDNSSPNTVFYVDEVSFVNELNNTLSVPDITSETHSLFPNPTTGTIHFTSPISGYTLTDMRGRQLATATETTTHIHISHIPAGIYTLSYTTPNDQLWHKKIIKK